MQVYYCPSCMTNWSSHQAIDSACCECKTGVRRENEVHPDEGTEDRFQNALRKQFKKDKSDMHHKQFVDSLKAKSAKTLSGIEEIWDRDAFKRG